VRHLTGPCLLALVHALVAQQQAVIPTHAATTEGVGADQSPFGRDRHRHVQYVDRSLLTAVPTGTTIRAIAYRREGGDDRRPTLRRIRPGEANQRPAWAVRLGNPTVDVRDPPREYPEITDPAWTLVRDPKPMTFPDLDLPADGLPGFDLVFPFDRPFVYLGGELGIEHYVNHRRQIDYPYVVDAVDARTTPGAAVTLDERDDLRVAAAVPGPGGELCVSLHGVPRGGRAALALRFSPDAETTPTTNVARPLEVPVRSDGGAAFVVRVPLDPKFDGRIVDAEWFVDVGAGPHAAARQRLTLGRLLDATAPRMAVVAGFSESHVRYGFVQRARGLVFQLRW
jgi:hypothetical protein